MTLFALTTAVALACKPGWEPQLHIEWATECLAITTPAEPAEGSIEAYRTDGPGFERPVTIQDWAHDRFVVDLTNLCDEDIELVQDDCDAQDCPFDSVIAPGWSDQLHLPILPEGNEATYRAQVLVGDEISTLWIGNDGGRTVECEDRPLLGCQTVHATPTLAWLTRRR